MHNTHVCCGGCGLRRIGWVKKLASSHPHRCSYICMFLPKTPDTTENISYVWTRKANDVFESSGQNSFLKTTHWGFLGKKWLCSCTVKCHWNSIVVCTDLRLMQSASSGMQMNTANSASLEGKCTLRSLQCVQMKSSIRGLRINIGGISA